MLDERKKRILIWGALGAVMLIIVLLAVLCGNPAEDTDLGNSSTPPQITDDVTDPITIPPNNVPKEDDNQDGEQDKKPAHSQNPEESNGQVNEETTGENGQGTSSDGTTHTEGQGNKKPVKVGKVNNLNGTVDGTTITLTWDKVDNATGYEIQVRLNEKDYVSVGQAITNNTTLNGFMPETEVWVKVRAYNTTMSATIYGSFSKEIKLDIPKDENSDQQGVTNIVVAQVANLTGTATYRTVTLNWDAVDNATGYEVYQQVNGNKYSLIGDTETNSYKVTDLKPGTTVRFKVRAYAISDNTRFYGDFSGVEKFTLKSLGKPINLKVNATSTTATITWDKVDGATGYEVYQKQSDGTYKLLHKVTTNSDKLTGLTPGSTIYIKVRAYVTEDSVDVYGAFSGVLKVVLSDGDTGTGDEDNPGGENPPGGGENPPGGGENPPGGGENPPGGGTTTPGGTTPGGTTPGGSTPGGSTEGDTGTTTPGGTTPGGTTPGGTTPGGSTPGGSTEGDTGTTTPGGTTPGGTTPGGTTPGGSTPGGSTEGDTGTTAPDGTTPGGTTPGGTTPGGSTPGGSTEGSTGTTTPGGNTPGGTTPGGTTPGGSTPGGSTEGSTGTTPPGGSEEPPSEGATTPGGTTPGGTTPGGTTPGGSTPGGSAEGSTGTTTPGGATPGGTTPGGSTPGGATPGGSTEGATGAMTPGASALPGGSTTPGGTTVPGGMAAPEGNVVPSGAEGMAAMSSDLMPANIYILPNSNLGNITIVMPEEKAEGSEDRHEEKIEYEEVEEDAA